jgi:carbohydrate-selective porin OprB
MLRRFWVAKLLFSVAFMPHGAAAEYGESLSAMIGLDSVLNDREIAIEAAYRAEILPGLILQPDLQYIINPSMDPKLDNALQVGLRLEMSF